MSGNYTYFISSLPLLLFGAKPPFSRETFFEMCAEHLSGDEVAMLKSHGAGTPRGEEGARPTEKKWWSFDTALRNELVRIRSAGATRSAQHKQGEKYVRGDGYTDPSIAAAVLRAHRNPSILEGERMLDEARWHALDTLEVGNYFNIDYLIIYTIKLSILARWGAISAADGERLVEETLLGERTPFRG